MCYCYVDALLARCLLLPLLVFHYIYGNDRLCCLLQLLFVVDIVVGTVVAFCFASGKLRALTRPFFIHSYAFIHKKWTRNDSTTTTLINNCTAPQKQAQTQTHTQSLVIKSTGGVCQRISFIKTTRRNAEMTLLWYFWIFRRFGPWNVLLLETDCIHFWHS